jgi:hypothetical protein
LAGAYFQDHLGPLRGFGIHLVHFCRNRGRAGKLV